MLSKLLSKSNFDSIFDVLIIGAGGAGLQSAVTASDLGSSVACVSKVHPVRSHTVAAQGGIAAAISNESKDKWEWHAYDTIKGSDWFADQDAVELMCMNAPQAIYDLEHMGVPFSRNEAGGIYQRKFGGMTTEFGKKPGVNRTCAASDKTGHAILHTMYQQCIKRNVMFFEEHLAIDFILKKNNIIGIVTLDMSSGKFLNIFAKTFIIATGGYGNAYRWSTNASICTGDGSGMALRAGLSLCDMEFIQFHPTGLYGSGFLITEACRGEGGVLLNSKGDRFMKKYAPMNIDLAPRDVVSRSIINEIKSGRGCGPKKDHVYLDISKLNSSSNLSGIEETCKNFANIDVKTEPIPVVPTAHYSMGGISTNITTNCMKRDGSFSKNVFAAGESSCVSVHGANRLGSNSLLDLIVFGKIAAQNAFTASKQKTFTTLKDSNEDEIYLRIETQVNRGGKYNPTEATEELQENMQYGFGPIRNEKSMKKSLKNLYSILEKSKSLKMRSGSFEWNFDFIKSIELQNLVAQSIATAILSIKREESRGSHFREDFPEKNNELRYRNCISTSNNFESYKITQKQINKSPKYMDKIEEVARSY